MAAIIERCHACREASGLLLSQLGSSPGWRAKSGPTLLCVALFSVIADALAAGENCPTALIDAAVEHARELPDDDVGCAAACRAAADALSEWLDGTFERGF